MLEQNLRRGPWYQEEDEQLTNIVGLLGERRWDALAQASGLRRSGKSCRLRWMNYLRPNLKHGRISEQEEQIITQLHQQWGNKWSRIARRLPGRTDNEIKNYWRSHLRKKLQVQEQEQENLESVLHDGEQSLLVSNCEGVSHGDFTGEKEEISGISGESSDAFELSDFALPSSPYETRVSDWISFWSSNEESHTMKHHTDYCSVDSCSCYLEKIPVESETSMWDCSGGSIWNMD